MSAKIIADLEALSKDPLATKLIREIEALGLNDTTLYHNFPLYKGEVSEELIEAHVMLASREFGVIFFRCLQSSKDFTDEEKQRLNNLDSHVFNRINLLDEFRIKRRELKINVTPFLFLNNPDKGNISDAIVTSELGEKISENQKEILSEEEYRLLLSAIEGNLRIKKKKERELTEGKGENTKGRVLTLIQDVQAVFDDDQRKAALNIIEGPQRIRGLAGSGKTIVLAKKAALYHLKYENADILYTYFTKALYDQVRYLIEKFYRDFSGNKEPDWKRIHILHGWGGSSLQGVYSETCIENGVSPIKLFDAKKINSKNPFNYVCKELESKELKEKYDLTLIDEGQDFPIYFYRLCRKITKADRIVWAYDDFQNIFDVEIQDERETFGKDKNGSFYIDFSQDGNELHDIPLQTCYRNSRYSLITAFSLGLGIYNDRVLQRLENNRHWEDLGFKVEQGDSSDNSKMVVSRPKENSPVELNEYFDENSVDIEVFEDIQSECNSVSNEIIKDIKEQELRPDDICVICLDTKGIESYFNRIQSSLADAGISSFNLLKAAYNNTRFTIPNHVTLSTLNKAKGNETGMVYIVGVDFVFQNKDFILERNKLFTAITRSKGWVKMTGHIQASVCVDEINKLKENDYKLVFTQPSKEETKTILRGMTQQQSILNDLDRKIESLVKTTGKTRKEILEMIMGSDKHGEE